MDGDHPLHLTLSRLSLLDRTRASRTRRPPCIANDRPTLHLRTRWITRLSLQLEFRFPTTPLNLLSESEHTNGFRLLHLLPLWWVMVRIGACIEEGIRLWSSISISNIDIIPRFPTTLVMSLCRRLLVVDTISEVLLEATIWRWLPSTRPCHCKSLCEVRFQ